MNVPRQPTATLMLASVALHEQPQSKAYRDAGHASTMTARPLLRNRTGTACFDAMVTEDGARIGPALIDNVHD